MIAQRREEALMKRKNTPKKSKNITKESKRSNVANSDTEETDEAGKEELRPENEIHGGKLLKRSRSNPRGTHAAPISIPVAAATPPTPSSLVTRIGLAALIFFLLLSFSMLYSLSTRLAIIEGSVNTMPLETPIMERLAFLEYFVAELHSNLTGTQVFYSMQAIVLTYIRMEWTQCLHTGEPAKRWAPN